MPLMDFDSPATWDYLYGGPYTLDRREEIFGEGMRDAHALRQALEARGMLPVNKVLIIGAGFGWLAKALMDAGYSQVVACDTSAYIQEPTRKAANATVQILNEGGSTTGSKRNIRSALGLSGNNRAPFVITEDIVPCFTDAEIMQYVPHVRDLGTTVVHWTSVLSPGNYAPLNWKSAADWKAMLSPDLIVARGSNVAI